jgi:hypothetical protein
MRPYASGLRLFNKIELEKMIAFYRTMNLSELFSEKVDLLVAQNIRIQYDPSADAILLVKVPDESDQIIHSHNRPTSLEPTVSSIIMLPGRPWVESDISDHGAPADFFEAVVVDDEDVDNWNNEIAVFEEDQRGRHRM